MTEIEKWRVWAKGTCAYHDALEHWRVALQSLVLQALLEDADGSGPVSIGKELLRLL